MPTNFPHPAEYNPPPLPDHQTPVMIINKLALSIGDEEQSLNTSFVEKDRESLWKKYQSASNPPLRAPLTRIRTDISGDLPGNQEWKEAFQALVAALPEDVRLGLLEESRKPSEERSASYGALDRVLGGTAQAIVWLRNAAHVEESISRPAVDSAALQPVKPKLHASVLSGDMAIQTIAQGTTILASSKRSLRTMGSNVPHFDEMCKFVNQMKDSLSELRDVLPTENQ